MSTPSIQTLITQAQQVLNLKSSNEIRATLAAILANANVGTPLNPNLTTQQLWDEFYEIVRQPSDDIMSIITDQMMRMVFSPPAPGGAGADKQVIFNDGGVLAGDPDLIFNKALNKLVANNIETAAGLLVGTSATITGDLTVDTSTLKVDSTNNRVGIGTASPGAALEVSGSATNIFIRSTDTNDSALRYYVNGTEVAVCRGKNGGSYAIETAGTERLRIDSTGNVGIGITPSAWAASSKAIDIGSYGVSIANTAGYQATFGNNCFYDGVWKYKASSYQAALYTQNSGNHIWSVKAAGTINTAINFTDAMTLDASGNLLVGTPSVVGVERLNVTKTAVGSALARFVNTNTTVDTYGIAVSYSASTPNDASHYFLGCFDSTTSRAFIYANGGLANYSANNVNLSDARTKTDIKPLASYWNKIKALELVTFKYKDQTHDDDNIGLISQQVESVAPEFVSNEGFGETPADGVPLKSIYTTDLYHAAIKALQEAMTRIEVLESKLA